ncbi:Ig-like domain-containing protein [Pseudalkalibacillus salsuginis]|uniref:Ig-like domain-containing protein n=1 Tax=Pseudalkalibacillus salsuginis TaxID=2910972 RepID=UPI001F41D5F5|nr:Ig-like domain-containing protein [Pseudalkalibacillus salsuginis]MCF6409980.1 Ig-like domain-containing protein [Pseudalkalibacillus salsuginis]
MRRKIPRSLLGIVILLLCFLSFGGTFAKESPEKDELDWIKIVPQSLNLKVSDTKQVQVIGKNKNDNAFKVKDFLLDSDNKNVLRVEGKNVVGISEGNTTLKATYLGKTDEIDVTVRNVPQNKSDYQVKFLFPDSVGTGEQTPVPITISTIEEKKHGYNNVHYSFEKIAGPGDVLVNLEQNEELNTYKNSFQTDSFNLPSNYEETLKTTMKFTVTGSYAISFKILSDEGKLIAEGYEVIDIKPAFKDLGTQIEKLTIMKGAFGKDENGREVAYTVIAGDPAKLAIVDLETEEVIKTLSLPEAEVAWAITVASDGTVYAGSTPNGSLYKYVPGSGEVVNLGKPVPGQTVIWDLTPGKDGKVYGGTYYDGHTFEYDPQEGFTDFGVMQQGEEYVRSVAYDEEEHVLYAGVGAHAHLIKYDINTGTKENILPEKYKDYISVYDLNLEGGKLFVKLEPNFQMFVMDKETGEIDYEMNVHSRGVSPLSPDGTKIYYTYAGILYEYNLIQKEATEVKIGGKTVNLGGAVIGFAYPELSGDAFNGTNLVGFVGNYNGDFFKYNLNTSALKKSVLDLPPQPTDIYNIGAGPDGKIYSSGFIGGGVGIYNPTTDQTVQETGLGQMEGMASIGNKIYFGVYPGARLYEYDTTRPWDRRRNLNHLFSLHDEFEQNRTVAIEAVEERNELYIASTPDYGKLGGALSIYNTTTGEIDVYRHIVQNQSVISLAEKENKIWAGTSVYGGTGQEPVETEAKLFSWDIESSEKEYESVPVPGKTSIGALIKGPEGHLWGLAQDTLFIFDPNKGETVYSSVEFPGAHIKRVGASLVLGQDGNIYGTVDQKFFRINAETKEVTILKENAKRLAKDNYGNIYFIEGGVLSNGNNIWRYTFEDHVVKVTGVTMSESDVTLTVDETYKLEASVKPSFATVQGINWSSSNSGVAEVSSDGTVTAISTGKATITAESVDGEKTVTATITVTD